jgi:lysophospholipase L1-like esterase
MSIINILCFGDSNTWGFIPGSDADRYTADVRWPGVMQSALGVGYKVIEEAQNGRMTVWDDPMEPGISKCGMEI